ncbi:MAG: Iron hydrogenase large subunit C-terminal domain-containing protein [uncultured Clostridium sp.]
MQYIFINPVVDKMYNKEELNEVLVKNNYKRIGVEKDWHGIVKEKYKEVINKTNLTILDRRCPLAIDKIEKYLDDEKVIIPKIEPILIHCAMEIANREELKGKRKIITTPCESLAVHGNRLNLDETIFISWKEFLSSLHSKENLKNNYIDCSPIPLGYFDSLGVKIKSISGKDNIKECFKNNLYYENNLVEMLYCDNGCNNGDGVLINE